MDARQEKRNAIGQKAIKYSNIAAEISNVGVIVHALGGWFPTFAAFTAATPFGYLMLIGDPAIYFMRSLVCVIKHVGKKYFKLEFKEEKHGPLHPNYLAANLFTLSCYAVAIALFCGVFIAPPVSITLAWAIGLLGRGCQGYFDYLCPERQALKKCHQLLPESSLGRKVNGEEEQACEMAFKEYADAKKSRQLFMAVLLGLSLLLLCGSAAAFAPPLLVPVLALVSNLASLGLGIAGVTRAYYFCKEERQIWLESKAPSPAKEIELQPIVLQEAVVEPPPSPRAQSRKLALPSRDGLFGRDSQTDSLPLQSLPQNVPREEDLSIRVSAKSFGGFYQKTLLK